VFGKAPQTLEDEKRVFDLGPDFRFLPVGSLVGVAQRPVSIGAVAVEAGFVSKEEIRHFVTVMDVGRGHAGVMDNPRPAV
jgi:hypothetical protein